MPNVVEFGARRTLSDKPLALHALADCACERLTLAFRETLSGCDDILFGHAQRAINGLRQAQYFDDLRQLRLSQEAAVRTFATACRGALLTGSVAPVAMSRRADDPLQLVADEDLEIDLALFRIGKRCDEAAPRLRHQVQRRLEIVYGLSDGEATPLGGAAIAGICRAGMAPLDIGLDSRLIVLKQVERHLSAAMDGLLEAVNALLVEQGILPNLKAVPPAAPRAASSPAAANAGNQVARSSPVSTPASPSLSTAAAAVDVQQLGEALNRMTQWMMRSPAITDPGDAPQVATIPAEEQVRVDDDRDLARARRREEIAHRRAAERERARELRIAAERSADVVVSMVMNQAHVPDGIGQAVGGPLRRHLEAVHARRGETSTEWRSACKLVRDIAWALDPETAASERAHWRAMVPGIVTALRAALTAAGADDAEVDRIVAEFGQRYEEMLADVQTEAPPQVAAESATDHPPAVVEDPKPTTPTHAPSYADVLRQVRQLTLGRWFELVDDQGRTQRAKLVWTSAMTERCLFVNGQGKLVADRPHARVANDILGGQFREIESGEAALA